MPPTYIKDKEELAQFNAVCPTCSTEFQLDEEVDTALTRAKIIKDPEFEGDYQRTWTVRIRTGPQEGRKFGILTANEVIDFMDTQCPVCGGTDGL